MIIEDALLFVSLAVVLAINGIVNGTLYNYGLHFSVNWHSQYSIYFITVAVLIVLSIFLTSFVGVLYFFEKDEKPERIGVLEKREISASSPEDSVLSHGTEEKTKTGFWASVNLPPEKDMNPPEKDINPPLEKNLKLPSEKDMTASKNNINPLEKDISAVFCRYCGFENESDAVFCQKCGKSLARKKKASVSTIQDPNPAYLFCNACGTKNRTQSRYCKKCGQPLDQ